MMEDEKCELSNIMNSEAIKRLKRHRSACKGHLTRVITRALEEVTINTQVSQLKELKQNLCQSFDKLKISCQELQRLFVDEIDIEESIVYLNEAETRFFAAHNRMDQLLDKKQSSNLVAVSNDQEINPADSVSQVTSSSTRSRSTHSRKSKSSLESMQIQNAAAFAVLQAEASALEQRQIIANEELRIAQMKEKLEWDEKMAKVKAENQVYEQFAKMRTRDKSSDDSLSMSSSSVPPKSFKEKALKQSKVVHRESKDQTFNFDPPISVFNPSSHRAQETQNSKKQSRDQSGDGMLYLDTMKQLATASLLPKSELMIFDGNPLKFSLFMCSFENNVEKCTSNFSKMLQLLIQVCEGKARKVIENCILLEPREGYLKAKQLLFERFGGAYRVSSSWLAKVAHGPQIKSNDGEALQDLADDLENCEIVLKASGKLSSLNNEDRLVRIIQRCPAYVKARWLSRLQEIRMENRDPNIEDLRKLIRVAANEKTDPVFGKILEGEKYDSISKAKINNRSTKSGIFNVSVIDDSYKRETSSSDYKCYFCQGNHKLENCNDFKRQDGEKQFKFIREKKLCDNCLSSFHFSAGCKRKKECTVQGCNILRKHLGVLHDSIEEFERKRSKSKESKKEDAQIPQPIKNASYRGEKQYTENAKFTGSTREHGAGCSEKGLPIVPVKVKCETSKGTIETYALLDSGSTASFCSESLLKKLKMHGKGCQIQVATINGVRHKCQTTISTIDVLDMKESFSIRIDNLFSTKCLNISSDSIGHQRDIDNWPHLKGIKLPERIVDSEVELLIGVDVPEALESYQLRKSENGGPFAIKTKFGWTLNGPLGRPPIASNSCLFTQFKYCKDDERSQLIRYFDQEFDDPINTTEKTMSVNDKKALKIVEESLCFKEGHYQMPIPWKDSNEVIPNNRFLAEQRLTHLKKKLSRNSSLKDSYSRFMDDLVVEGYAKKVSEDDKKQIVWYLPHHNVVNQNKPDKVRIVFDCAAKYEGKSLNDRVHQGPDLTNSLIGVLCRFRQEKVAIVADIQAMYHQVRVDPKDIGALRFLWYSEGDITNTPDEYQMLVHLFGGVWSSFCANYALQRTAIDNAKYFCEEVVNTVLRDFYIDDLLKSVETLEEAIMMQSQLKEILLRGGFHLTKWSSNSRDVLNAIPKEECSKEIKQIDIHDDKLPTGRTLGIEWDTELDVFRFTINIKEKPATRRNILSTIASIFDPLGFVSPCILPAKILLQVSCHKMDWDEEISERDQVAWKQWVTGLPRLEKEFKMKRCLKSGDVMGKCTNEIHHFADASEKGYGTVSYLRSKNNCGKINCAFLFAKSRVAPTKKISVPRLELTAATLAVKIDSMLRREMEIEISDSIFWTDSTSVLCYINNEERRFQTFVANRVAMIHNCSHPGQWHYIESKVNPADDVSRGVTVDQFLKNLSWSQGPEFLWKADEPWTTPQNKDYLISYDDKEVKRTVEAYVTQVNEVNMTSLLFSKFSEWFKLKRSVAWLIRYKNWLKKKNHDQELQRNPELRRKWLSVEEIIEAEHSIIKCIQHESFQEEISALKKDTAVKISSNLRSLDPVLKDDLLCVGGRLKLAPYEFDASRNPVILPKSHYVSDIIIQEYHYASGHFGHEYVLSLIREKYWIIQARVPIKRIVRNCFKCKRRRSEPMKQKMADLPEDRVSPDKPPFSAVGVDYFGPFLVKRGRALVKRYGVVFTCLAIRAVHIEIAYSLDTNSFINALKRFIARRGNPDVIRSDNGTNLRGGERELREAIRKWNQAQIHEFLLRKEIRWIFNPPAASHMGGVWERMVRSMKRVFYALLKNQSLDDESLQTLMCEVEAILNARPLTKTSDDPRDLKAITPNHLLLLRSDAALPCEIVGTNSQYCHRRWKHIQLLANAFWKRWLREYLPTLQLRQKWHTPKRNLSKDDIVLVVENALPRNYWSLGRVVEVFKGRDGLVRFARIKTTKGEVVRPITKLCLLEGE